VELFINPIFTGKLVIYPAWYLPGRSYQDWRPCLYAATNTLLGGVKDISSSDGTSMHLVVYHLELGEADDLVWCLYQATSEEVNGLCGVLAVADVGT
jgi:hypothetical protein